MRQRNSLGLGGVLLILFMLLFALDLIKEAIDYYNAMTRPAPAAKVLSKSDVNDKPFIKVKR